MYVAFFEIIAVVWIYGAGRLAENLKEMTGKLPSFYFRCCWYFAAPVLIFVSKGSDACPFMIISATYVVAIIIV